MLEYAIVLFPAFQQGLKHEEKILAVGSFFCKLFELGVVYTIFRSVVNRVRHNLLTDFSKVFDFSQDGETGSWLTPLQVVQVIEEKTGRLYDALDASRFLENQEYATKKILKQNY